jgi:hypothetical protein
MTKDEILAHALRLANIELECMEFCAVYEDEELEDASEADQRAIHRLVVTGVIRARIDSPPWI